MKSLRRRRPGERPVYVDVHVHGKRMPAWGREKLGLELELQLQLGLELGLGPPGSGQAWT